MHCAMDLTPGDEIVIDANRFRITKADVHGYKIDITYVPVDGGDEISETLTVDDYVEIIWWEGKEAETGATPEEIAADAHSDAQAEALWDRDNDVTGYYSAVPHFDTGAAGRDVCPKHGTELDPFGACLRCDNE